MKTIILPAESRDSLNRALEVLRHGGLVAFPTDTVYGLGALASDAEAVESIYRAKERPNEKAIPVLIGAQDDLNLVAAVVSEMARRLAARFWPGPLTLIVQKHSSLPDAISSDGTVGVRLPNHRAALELLGAVGPMAVTSANLSSERNPVTAADVRAQLDGRVDLILDGGPTPGGIPSTVVDCTHASLQVIRAGPISPEDLKAALA